MKTPLRFVIFGAVMIATYSSAQTVPTPAIPPALDEDRAYAEALRKAERDAEVKLMLSNLKNRTKAKEAGKVLNRAVHREPILLDGVNKVELVKFFDATEKPMQHRDSRAEVQHGGYAENALVGRSGTIMTWGPYVNFDPGRYLVVYRFRFPEPVKGHNVCFLDVAHKAVTYSGRRPGADEIEEDQWNEIAIPVDAPKSMEFEFRFWPHNNPVAIDRIYLFHLHGKSPQAVSVMGAVAKSGFYSSADGKNRVQDLVKLAGGLNDGAHQGRFKIWQRLLRRGNITETISVNINQNATESTASIPPGGLIWIPEKNSPGLMGD